MNKFIAKIFRSAGVDAKVSKDSESPKFRVVENNLVLNGVVKPNRYTMSIKDKSGKSIDNLSVVISNSNDVVNRINESIQTLHMLSKAYDNKKLAEEAEEFDDISADEPEVTLEDGLENLYDTILDAAEKAESLVDAGDEDDAEQLSTLISFASALYDTAIDVDDYRDELFESDEEDEIDESVKKQISKTTVSSALKYLTMAEAIIRKTGTNKDISSAIKDIKSELTLRG